MNVYAYIKRTYGVDPKIGQRITMDGKPGTIIRPSCDPHYLNVRFDGQSHGSNVHPTWRVDYNPPTLTVSPPPAPAAPDPASSTKRPGQPPQGPEQAAR